MAEDSPGRPGPSPITDFAPLTVTPDRVSDAEALAGALGRPAPLPALTSVAGDPPLALVEPVVHPGEDPLVRLGSGPRVALLEAYRWARWPATVPGMYLRRSVVARLHRVAAALPEGFGLALFDAWRPLPLQDALHQVAYADPNLPPGFVAPADPDPRRPPPHLTGGTVDLTLTWAGRPLALGTSFDDFTDAAHTASLEDQPGTARDLRRLLYHAMRAQDFVVIECEWWHFELGTRVWAAVTGEPARFGAAGPPPLSPGDTP